MTELEQKAEEYADDVFLGNDTTSAYYRNVIVCGYKDGYEQGQKDSDTFKSFQNGYEHCALECAKDIEVLTKENAELKAQIEKLEGYKRVIDNLKAEGFDSVMAIKDYINKTNEEIADLRQSLDFANQRETENFEQIEKMKNCENCKHNKDYDFCFGSDCNKLDKWELEK